MNIPIHVYTLYTTSKTLKVDIYLPTSFPQATISTHSSLNAVNAPYRPPPPPIKTTKQRACRRNFLFTIAQSPPLSPPSHAASIYDDDQLNRRPSRRTLFFFRVRGGRGRIVYTQREPINYTYVSMVCESKGIPLPSCLTRVAWVWGGGEEKKPKTWLCIGGEGRGRIE